MANSTHQAGGVRWEYERTERGGELGRPAAMVWERGYGWNGEAHQGGSAPAPRARLERHREGSIYD